VTLPRLVTVTGLLLALATPLRAQPSDANQKRAVELVNQGLKHDDLGEYDQAIDAYKQAYELTGEPDIMYLLGQAYRGKGDCAQARRAFEKTIELKPDTKNRATIDSLLPEMKACEARGNGAASGGATGAGGTGAGGTGAGNPTTGTGATANGATANGATGAVGGAAAPSFGSAAGSGPATDGERHPGRGKVMIGAAGIVVGVLTVGTGVYFGKLAGDRASEVEAYASTVGSVWDADHQELERQGKAYSRTAILFTVGGGALAIGGTVILILGLRDGHGDSRPVVSASTDGAVGGWAWTF
jgi:tetratricopeptide (TPR) repeat protein